MNSTVHHIRGPQSPLDRLGRPLHDLRISVMDRCNFRCPYCMPKARFGPGHRFLPRAEALDAGEIVRLGGVEGTFVLPEPTPEQAVLKSERADQLWRAFRELPAHCQALLRLLMASPPPSYAEIAAAIDRPVGSIGPSRARCLRLLRGMLAE